MIDMYNMEDERDLKHCCPMINYGMMCPKMMEANTNYGTMPYMGMTPPCMNTPPWHVNSYNSNMGYMQPAMNYPNTLAGSYMNVNPMMLRMNGQYSGQQYINMTPVSIEELQD